MVYEEQTAHVRPSSSHCWH